jgi:hypothetical protein
MAGLNDGPLVTSFDLQAGQFMLPQRLRDTNGRIKISAHQNIFDADFEYGTQPLRWEGFTYNTTYGQNSTNAANTALIVPMGGLGGVEMQIASLGDITIRQSRPYNRYQPGKSMYIASNVNFGGAVTGQVQRVGIFDDGNGIFFQQSNPTSTNPFGINVVVRSDSQLPSGGSPVDTIVSYENWTDVNNIKSLINWNYVQMIWMEYSWYGAGALRWGVIINGEPYILHEIGTGNGTYTGTGQIVPWSRTGSLPVRYEQRNLSSSVTSIFRHFGVSVLIEGSIDKQRGFTYSYGMNPATPTVTVSANKVRYPLISFRMRAMGQSTFTQASTNGAVTSGTTTTLVASAAPFSTSTTPLAITGNGTTATIIVQASGTMPAVGSALNVSGVTPSGFNNASATVTAVTPNTISYSNATSGTASVFGTTVYVPSVVGRQLNYFPLVAASSGAPTTISSATQGTTNFTGTIAANTSILTVSAVASGTIINGMVLGTISGGTFVSASSVVITSQLGGVTGGVGTYLISQVNTGSLATVAATSSATGGTVTVNLAAAHSLTTNDVVTLSGFSPAAVNGIYPVIAVTSTAFTVNVGYGNAPGSITTTSGSVGAQYTARITANTSTALTFQDVVTGLALPYAPTASCVYTVGLIDRGQLLPQSLIISSTATCLVELIASTPTIQVGLSGANFQAEAVIGAAYSFAERDNTAGYLSGGEVVYSFTSPPSGLQTLDLSNFFPVLTNIKGNIPDILTVAVTTTTSTPIGVNVICQEAMS